MATKYHLLRQIIVAAKSYNTPTVGANSPSYTAKTPGSLMLFGEHAVLHGNLAICCAIGRHINAQLTPRADQTIAINSDLLGTIKLQINNFTIKEPWQMVLTAIAHYLPNLPGGFDLQIDSEFSATVGFGSSAAVVVATVTVIEKWLQQQHPEEMTVFTTAKNIVQKVQGVGSGADVAASAFNSTVAYRMEPLSIEKLVKNPPLSAVYSGTKMPTVEVIKKVDAAYSQFPEIFTNLYKIMDQCAQQAVPAINNQDWEKLGKLMNIHHGIQDAIGTNNKALAEIVFALRECPNIYGAKISGSGLGDCAIGLGKLEKSIKQIYLYG